MNVLSVFDGMSCGRIALERAGIEVNNYYSSEIDKYAIQIANKNYPQDAVNRLGDVTTIKASDLPNIDLLIGGSPCQNLSLAIINNVKHNKGLDGEKSGLFYEYLRLKIELKPKYFLLENVSGMKVKDKDLISSALGVEPIQINSNLFTAQDRDRCYWTNIPVDLDIEDRGILLKDIILDYDKVDDNFWYNIPFKYNGDDEKIQCTLNLKGHDIMKRVYNINGKVGTLTCCRGGNLQKKIYQNGKCRKLTPLEYERLQTVPDNYTSKGLDIHSQTLYNGNECNTKEVKCQKSVESKNVISLSQVGKLNSAINTILGSLDMEQLKPLENLSIKAKSVLSMGAKENSKQLKVCASSIINLGKENSLLMEAKNVRYAISQLETGQMECALSIISNSEETETLYRMKLESTSLSETEENTIKTKMVDGLIGELQKKLLEENSEKEKLYIILTLINSITALAILKFSQTQSTSLCIDSSNLLQENLLEMDLLNLKTVNIVDVSNSSRYNLLGNGWTVDVIAHIFKGLLNEK